MSLFRKLLPLACYVGIPAVICGVLVALQTGSGFFVLLISAAISTAISTGLLYVRSEKQAALLSQQVSDVEGSLSSTEDMLPKHEARSAGAIEQPQVAIQNLKKSVASRIRDLLEKNQELSKRYSQFQSILARMSEGVLLLEAEGRILYCNQFAGKLLGREPKEVEKKLLWEVVRTPGLELAIAESMLSGEGFREEIEIQRTHCIIELSAVQLDIKSGSGLVIVLHDFTELRRLERLRREFVSNVSHELKTPLTSIQVYTDTLLDGGLEDADNRRGFVERIQEQSERLQQLIQDMLRLARIEAQSEAFQLSSVSLCETVSECVEARMAIAEARGIALSYYAQRDEIFNVLADEEGMRTIFENLINNALNYTAEGGEVEVRCVAADGNAVVEVQDNGMGIAAEHQSRIFERFYRIDKARSRGMGGTGLGLAIVKHCVNEFNGTIELNSEVGHGTTFRVSFPLVKSEVAATIVSGE